MGASWLSDGDTTPRGLVEARYRNPPLEHRVEALLTQQVEVAVEVIRQREREVRALVATLVERKKLSGDEVRDWAGRGQIWLRKSTVCGLNTISAVIGAPSLSLLKSYSWLIRVPSHRNLKCCVCMAEPNAS